MTVHVGDRHIDDGLFLLADKYMFPNQKDERMTSVHAKSAVNIARDNASERTMKIENSFWFSENAVS